MWLCPRGRILVTYSLYYVTRNSQNQRLDTGPDLVLSPGISNGGLPAGSVVKNLPAMQETSVSSLGQEDPLEKEMATHSSILAWETPWTEEPGGLQFMGLQRVGHDLVINNNS